MMQRIGMVAARDFVATVSNKGFVIGLLITPVALLLLAVLGPRFGARAPVSGQIAVIDPTQSVVAPLRSALDQAARGGAATAGDSGAPAYPRAAQLMAVSRPQISIAEPIPADNIGTGKRWLTQPDRPGARHLALVVVQPDAVVRASGHADYGSYDLFLAPHVDEPTEAAIQDGVRKALIAARLKSANLDRESVESLMRVVRPTAVTVNAAGEQPARRGFAQMLPFICGVLIFIGVITGGQILLTSTVEEKSSRVVEVLLAAVSPVELMAGKLLGQLGVGLLIMGVYLGLGVLALTQYSLAGQLEPMLIIYLVVFYLLAYLVYGGLMLAIGAAVNQLADAQSLMGPVMLLMIAPYVLVPFIGRAPNSALSIAMSFVPPINSFAILARLASDTPPPLWQIFGAILAGVAGAIVAVWFAAKIFRIGLLMHGKPPNFATLVRWARMA